MIAACSGPCDFRAFAAAPSPCGTVETASQSPTFGSPASEGADFDLTASFAGAPAGVAPFTINTDLDKTMGLIGVGLDVINGDDAALRLSYDAQIGETTQIHSFGLKGGAKF